MSSDCEGDKRFKIDDGGEMIGKINNNVFCDRNR